MQIFVKHIHLCYPAVLQHSLIVRGGSAERRGIMARENDRQGVSFVEVGRREGMNR